MSDIVIEVGPIDESLEPDKFEYRLRHQACGDIDQCIEVRGGDSCHLHCAGCGMELEVAKEGMIEIWFSSVDQHRSRDISSWVRSPGVRCTVVPVPYL